MTSSSFTSRFGFAVSAMLFRHPWFPARSFKERGFRSEELLRGQGKK